MGKRTSVASLNDDVLLLVLGRLPVPERAAARLVCRRWAALLGGPRAWADVPAAQGEDYLVAACRKRGGRALARVQKVMALVRAPAAEAATQAIWAACENGNLPAAQWLRGRFYPEARATRLSAITVPSSTFGRVCGGGDLRTAQWLAQWFRPLSESLYSIPYAFEEACGRGHLSIVRWLAECPRGEGFTASELANLRGKAVYAASSNGHPAVMRWLIARYGVAAISSDPFTLVNIFTALCARGKLPDVRWLVKALEGVILYQATSVWGIDGFQRACRHGNLPVAAWLAERFGTQEVWLYGWDPPYATVLGEACLNGHLSVVRWLVGIPGIPWDEAVIVARAFEKACQGVISVLPSGWPAASTCRYCATAGIGLSSPHAKGGIFVSCAG